MLSTKTCINVYSVLNDWIDFCITISAYEDFAKAEEIVQATYNNWFDGDIDEPIADYISQCLTENDIEHEIYFKAEEN